ncbi:MAG TPA: asparagine synthase-related protein [Solirubrobacteraceae bacterium]
MRIPNELTRLEAVAGSPLGGRGRSTPRLGRAGCEPLAALASVIEGTLGSGPPAVAFSGGRDSSLLLAVAAGVCERAGVDPPLPITLCMPTPVAEADEREWQELVLEHLEIPDWHRIEIDGELDLVGPYARRHLLRDGLLFPANAHSVVPMLEAAGDRVLIVGLGGDELLSSQQWRSVHDLVGRRRKPRRRDLVRLAGAAVPSWIRWVARPSLLKDPEEMDWLRPAARRRLDRLARRGFEEPVGWRTAVRQAAARRDVILPLRTMERLAQAGGHRIEAPLLDAKFVGALARAGGRGGWGGRTATMNALARELLPEDVLGRASKAHFNRVFFGEETRAFAESWSGRGLDETLVDPEALRREWLSEVPDFRTSLLLQSAWLTDHALEPPAVGGHRDLVSTICL